MHFFVKVTKVDSYLMNNNSQGTKNYNNKGGNSENNFITALVV